MLDKLFPFILHLHILQLEEYQLQRFYRWIFSHYFKRAITYKKKLIWTHKANLITYLSVGYLFILCLFLINKIGVWGLVIGVIFGTQPYIFLTLGLLTLKPYEAVNRIRVKIRILHKVRNLKESGLQVIGIAGSYGKTSVKEFLYKMLKSQYKVLRTPESYNTLFGILKVVDYELDSIYDFFICEMGAYKIGEIRELSSVVEPDHAVLTGINEQHIDRFKKIENTIKAKFEVFELIPKKGICVANGLNEYILRNYERYRSNVILYGSDRNLFKYEDLKLDVNFGSQFTLVLNGQRYEVETNLLGKANIENILAASTMSFNLGIKTENIIETIKNLKPIPHRQELKTWANGLRVIDDAYSSNVTGFEAALELLNDFAGLKKYIATPGIVELGENTEAIHMELGKKIEKVCDHIYLVGESERTKALEKGISNVNKVSYIDSLDDLYRFISDIKNSIVLVENDLPDNY